ncbi:MAG: D-glycero-beta-D-manno-heptose 1,7-bisphosphate 7-phosphatase [Negativicutes bacterium]|jgi:D-glycero-D-manno-heptose 1,7-bisphosphate phosphatase
MNISNFKFQNSDLKRAVFFDRDGVLNVDHGYVYKPDDWQWTPGAIEAIKWCNDNNFLVVVVTNQSGVARGYYTETDVVSLHDWVNEDLRKHNARIDAFYYCPHYPDAKNLEYAKECACRKPQPGMLLQAIARFDIDADSSIMFGDKPSDIEAATAAGIRGVLVEKNAGWLDVLAFIKRVG